MFRKNLKNIILIVLIFQKAVAQSNYDNGIYVSGNDFLNKKLTFGFNNNQEGYKLQDTFFEINKMKIITPQKTVKLMTDTIWGYRIGNQDWRIYKDFHYKILFISADFFVYEQSLFSDNGLERSYYYFSKNEKSDLITLSKKRIIREYSIQNKKFTTLVKLIKSPSSITDLMPPNNSLRIIELYKYISLSHSQKN